MRSPREVAEGAADRLCAYDATETPGDYARTTERVADFLAEFVLIVAPRLHAVAHRADPASTEKEA